jgi:hypothetical protein
MERHYRPDMFDIKYLRDELYYYSRDENQFLRRRRTFVFVLTPDLAQARFKDADLPVQRIVMILGLLRTMVLKLIEWLNADALVFEFVFVNGEGNQPSLPQEYELLQMLLREQIANGTVQLRRVERLDQVGPHCTMKARRSLCHCMIVSASDARLQAEDTVVTRVVVDGPRPALGVAEFKPAHLEAEDAFDCWAATLERLLQIMV